MYSQKAYLDHSISLNVVFETLELQMEYGGERLEDDAFPCVLESMTFRHVLVITFKSLNGYIILEGFVEILHPFNIELNVWKGY